MYAQKQPSRGVLNERCSENMQQIYSRTPMPKCAFNKVASQISLRHGCSPINLLHIFRTLSYNKTSGWLLLYHASEIIILKPLLSALFNDF